MKIKFLVEDQVVFGEISPKQVWSDEYGGMGATKSVFEIDFISSISNVNRIHRLIDSLGQYHVDKYVYSDADGCIHGYARYFGSDYYVATFYEALGLTIPALSEGREPSMHEIINFVYPPVWAAGGAASGLPSADVKVKHAEIAALYDTYRTESMKLSTFSDRYSLSKLKVSLFQSEKPSLISNDFFQAIADRNTYKALYLAQKEVVNLTLHKLSVHLPAVVVPPSDTMIHPLDTPAVDFSVV